MDGPAAARAEVNDADRIHGIAGRTILVVEDDPDILDMVCTVVESRGGIAAKAGTAAAARIALGERSFDALVLDWNLPDMSGNEFLAWLRRYHADVRARTLVITGRLTPVISTDIEAGTTVLPKPFRPSELIDALAELTTLGSRDE